LIHDAQFTPEEKRDRPAWGHSSWREAVEVARRSGVQKLVLFHHDPMHTDDELEAIEAEARALFPATLLAREGMEITV
jgi:ribonuclease BN (tRNA processing enzyme)